MTRLHPRTIDVYWDLVEETIRSIFSVNPAGTGLYDLRALIEQLPAEEQETFYHSEALDVAGDLLDISNDTLHQVAPQYDQLKHKLLIGRYA
jgi:hypothetical protein